MSRCKISKKRRLADTEVRAEIDRQAMLKKRGLRQLRQRSTHGGA